MSTFVHLHVHSEYSLRESTLRISQLVNQAVEHDAPAVAVTDRNGLYGAVKFYKAARKAGIKPILGVQLSVCKDQDLDEAALGRPRGPQIDAAVLLAESLEGYRNLVKLVSLANTRHRNPVVTLSEAASHRDGVIALIAGSESQIARSFAQQSAQTAREWLHDWHQIWRHSHLYIDVQDHGMTSERQALRELLQWATEAQVPVVATNDVHYLYETDAGIQRTLSQLDNSLWNSPLQGNRHDFASPAEMERRLGQIPNAIENTLRIAERCTVELPLGQAHMPKYPTSSGEPAAEVLTKAARVGMLQRYGTETEELRDRLDYELEIINRLGFADYFLVVADFIRFAHKNGISTGPGRGSAAGSLVAYSLRITDVDPLSNRLLFERFLNPERVNWPDIDTDFEYERRNEVIQYVLSRYGQERVAQIGTFGTLAARAALRDVGRALQTDAKLVDRVAKLVPGVPGMTLKRARKEVQDLNDLLQAESRLKPLWEQALALEGLPRHTSVHAAGVVISPFVLSDLVPVQEGADGIPVTQYDMEDVEALGLVKMDFLGLRTLTLIDNTANSIKARTGKTLNWTRIPDGDKATFQMLGRGETEGCFQLESAGVRRVLRDLRPTRLEDLIAVISLYRPGPMENIPTFIKARHGRIPVSYPHPDLEQILKDTYGVIVYQEQIMQIAARMAGFSLGQADLLRRAVGKKKRDVLDAQRSAFVSGAVANGYDEETADQVYDLVVRFADYGYNRSHAAAYAVLSYRTAWLRANYLPDFLAALLSMTVGNAGKEAEYKKDAKKHKIEVLSPSVQTSDVLYTVESKNVIRTGLLSVRNVGKSAVENIMEVRNNGQFTSLVDFLQRINSRTCNRKAVESLLEAGALDDFLPASVSPEVKKSMLGEAYNEAAEGKQMAGLGLQFDRGNQSANSARVEPVNGTVHPSGGQESSSPKPPNVLYIRYGPQPVKTPSAAPLKHASTAAVKETILKKVRTMLTDAPGATRVVLYDSDKRKTRLLEERFSVELSPELIGALEEIVGMGNVKIGRMPSTQTQEE
ncbi:DNA polymerase III subunit alpha [Alicyclobacillus sp. SO9]|uniref:DNA polymerase III subunit alpha n=1 Tax=Alicyclobacillus sp. SO9 TaxID=2665646 RepID=UPI0018E80CE1|nr:DNA polymerase III subunit alpha [Alicyclobacillus sp. SO9]QQE81416.1 DNA polymerase III subunit alpha [Alicyclobacillus sp. SO9]